MNSTMKHIANSPPGIVPGMSIGFYTLKCRPTLLLTLPGNVVEA